MRSTLISGCFVAYGIGCIALNIVTMFVRTADNLILTSAIMVYLSCIPPLFSYHETPKYLLRTGKLTRLVQNLIVIGKANGNKIGEEEIYLEFVSEDDYELIKKNHLEIEVEEVQVAPGGESMKDAKATGGALASIGEFFGSFK